MELAKGIGCSWCHRPSMASWQICCCTERLAASSRKTEHRLQGTHFCQSSAPVNLRRIQHAAHCVIPLQTFVQEKHPCSKHEIGWQITEIDKNTNKQQCQASPCLGLALQTFRFPPCGPSDCFSEATEQKKGPWVRKGKKPDPEP